MRRLLNALSKRERLIIYTTLGIIIFSFAFNFLIEPFLTKNKNLNKEIGLTRTKLKKYMYLLSNKEKIQEKYSKFFSHLKAQDIKQEAAVSILSELENLAKATDIKIIDVRPHSISKAQDFYKEILVDLRTEGKMENYLKFLYSVETSPLLLRIKKFQLTAKPNTSILEGSFSISQIVS